MKFHLNHDPANKTLTIPRAALQLSGLAETQRPDRSIPKTAVFCCCRTRCPSRKLLKTFHLLTAINAELLFRLAKSSAAGPRRRK